MAVLEAQRIAQLNLPALLIDLSFGLVGEDGETHRPVGGRLGFHALVALDELQLHLHAARAAQDHPAVGKETDPGPCAVHAGRLALIVGNGPGIILLLIGKLADRGQLDRTRALPVGPVIALKMNDGIFIKIRRCKHYSSLSSHASKSI